MRFEFSDDQRQFQETVRVLLTREYSVKKAWAGEAQPIWLRLAELGVLGVAVPESAGGLGGSALDWVLLAEEAGRAALALPLAEAFAAPPLLSPDWLKKLVEGRATIALSFDGALVPEADLYILRRENVLHVVPRTLASLKRAQSVDGSRRLFRVDFSSSTRIDGDADAAFDTMALATSAELLGLAQQLIDVTVEYVKVRQQFGAPVGSFQAVKHVLANALLELEFARPFVYRAAYQKTPVNVSMAKAGASDAAHRATRAALQCHGAIGYSFEHDLHMWMKRVWCLEKAWGSASWHRERIAQQLLDGDLHEPSLYR